MRFVVHHVIICLKVKNDEMLGRTDNTTLHIEIMKLQQENKQLKEELKYTVPIVEHNKIVSKKLKENQNYKEVIDKISKHCEIEINASNHY